MKRISAYLDAQASDLPRHWARVYLVSAAGLPAAGIIHGIWAVLFWMLDIPVLALWDLGSTLLWAICSWALITRRGLMLPVTLGVFVENPLRAILATYFTGTISGFWAYMFVAMMGLILVPFAARPLRYALAAGFGILTALTAAMPLLVPPPVALSPGWEMAFLLSNLIGTGFVIIILLSVFDVAVDRAETALEREFDRAEGLLRNILPDAIALRLKDGEQVIADEHEEVSVIFADIVNFTEASAKLTPAELVQTLNIVFTEFDRLAAQHGAEKIKTIGDAYMAVVGVPDAQESHAAVAVEIALAMRDAARKISDRTHFPIDLRIGVNSGPVVAGVIGTRKFAYDLWGDAVNVASRMEAHALPGDVMITGTTRALLPGRFKVRPEGSREVKGKGQMQVFSVTTAALHAG